MTGTAPFTIGTAPVGAVPLPTRAELIERFSRRAAAAQEHLCHPRALRGEWTLCACGRFVRRRDDGVWEHRP